MSPKELGALVLLGALWGSSYIFIRVAVPELGPFALMGLRVSLAAVVLAGYVLATIRTPKTLPRYTRLLFLGGLNAAIPFSLIAFAEIHLTASLAAILNSTTALFSAVAGSALMGESMTARKVAGLVLGFLGVVALVGWDPLSLNTVVLISVGAMLLASLSYALGGVYAKQAFAGIPSPVMAVGQQAGAAAFLIPLGALSLPDNAPSPAAGLSALALALLCTALAYLLYFYLIETAGPTRTLTVTFLIPAFGLLFGAAFLGEPVGVGTFVGLGVILAGVALVTGVNLGGGKRVSKSGESPDISR